jgi:release factor glutamine methyltransferase
MNTPQNLNEWKIVASYEDSNIPQVMSTWSKLSHKSQFTYHQKFELLRAGYPLDYLLKYTEINGFKFILNKHVLIPRPETQKLIDYIISLPIKPHTLVDIGSGSGFISLQLAKCFEHVIAIDISPQALEVSQQNAALNQIHNVKFIESDLIKNVEIQIKYWWLVANLPYVPYEDKLIKQQNNIEYEPELAIFADKNGLGLWYKLMEQLFELEQKPEKLFFELDSRNIMQASQFLDSKKIQHEVILDENELPRFLIIDSF